jgi:deubiquitinase DESI2
MQKHFLLLRCNHDSGYAGAVCNCVLPESLKIAAVQQDPICQTEEEEDDEKRRLTGALSCFSSISLCPRQLSSSPSLFMHALSKGLLINQLLLDAQI